MSNPNSSEQSGKPPKKPKITPPPLPPNMIPASGKYDPEAPLPEGWRMSEEVPIDQPDKVTYLSAIVDQASYQIFNLIGYGLIGLFVFDFISLIFPARFTDLLWEMRLMGQLVEKVPVPLMGIALIFLRRESYVRKVEMKLLQVISWFALVIGVMYLLMIPLFAINTKRINDFNEKQISSQVSQQSEQARQAKDQIQKANDKQVKDILVAVSPKNAVPKIDNPREVRQQLLAQVGQAESNIQEQANATRSSQSFELFKNSLKWIIGALLSGILLVWIWRISRWTRTLG